MIYNENKSNSPLVSDCTVVLLEVGRSPSGFLSSVIGFCRCVIFWLKPSGWNSPKKRESIYLCYYGAWWFWLKSACNLCLCGEFHFIVWYGMVWYGAMMRWYHFLVFGAMVNGGHLASLPSPQSVAQYKLPQSAKASFSSGRFVSWFIFITTDITMCLFVLFLCEELPNYFPHSVERK